MKYAVSMYVERGRYEGRYEGRQEGRQRGIQEEKIRGATAFVKESILQKQSEEYIMDMLQTCFQLKKEAANLYRKGYESGRKTEIPAFT
ncbi:MAG: hypothetical protein K2H37_14080 [Lachnospiraceae bacterium]|nr:hypothetical protein [Lachnospiraceae bacterium]